MAERRRGVDGLKVLRWVFLAFLLAFTVLPMLWMVSTSIKTEFASIQQPPQWVPANPTLEQYYRLLSPANEVGREFLRYLLNSLWVSTATTVLGVLVGVPAAYAFSRFHFPGRHLPFYAVLVRNMFPAVIFLVPGSSQSHVSIDQPSGLMPSEADIPRARRFQSPKGARASAGAVPTASSMTSQVRASCSCISAGRIRVSCGWLQEWLAIRWPPSAMAFSSQVFAAASLPMTQNVACTPQRRSTSSTCGVYSGSGPSSKVRAISRSSESSV